MGCTAACNGHKWHKAKFYNDIGTENATNEGYHANEAKRLLDYNDQNKEVNEKHARKTQEDLSQDLNELNKPNSYNTKKEKSKKKRFRFYM